MDMRLTLKRWAAYMQTVRDLGKLSNEQLNRLGIDRRDVAKIAREHARRLVPATPHSGEKQ